MAKKPAGAGAAKVAVAPPSGRPSSVLDTRVVYCGLRRSQSSCDTLEQLAKLPDQCIDLIYIDPPFNSNRNYEVFWGGTKEKRAFEDPFVSTPLGAWRVCVATSRVTG